MAVFFSETFVTTNQPTVPCCNAEYCNLSIFHAFSAAFERYHRIGQTHQSTTLGNTNSGDALRAGISLRGWKGSINKLNTVREVLL
jgi:hypothetical protein